MDAPSLVVTDLDGTLWDGAMQVHPTTRAAVAALGARGIPWIAATGRRHRSAAMGLARVGLAPPAVTLDGAVGRHTGTGEWFHRQPFDPPDAVTALEAFEGVGLSPCVYVDRGDIDVVVDDAPSTHPAHLASLAGHVERGDPARAVQREPVYGLGIVGGDPATLQRVLLGLDGRAAGAVVRDHGVGGGTLVVRPRGVSKIDGVRAYCATEGLDPERILAIGDGENDVELLRAARTACTVADGSSAARAVADHVLPPTVEGGWAAILDLW